MDLLNTLYITTQHAYVHLDHDTVRVEVDKTTTLRVPLIHLDSLVCFGDVLISPALLQRCGEDGRSVVLLDRNGRFKARFVGPTRGNVLLRRAQHEALSSPDACAGIARNVVAGKIQNCRQVVLRAARESGSPDDHDILRRASNDLATGLDRLRLAMDLDTIRGCEGEAARVYFGGFSRMVRVDRDVFGMELRTRRPPLDPLNAALSFVYALLLNDCVSALEGTGLDPQVGYLHALRPGRPALALDLMEELRPALADRLVLTLVNRRQLSANDFEVQPSGATLLSERGRKEVVIAYQKRKQEQTRHRVLDRAVPVGLVPHVQSRLLARHLRGDTEAYLPFLIR